MKGGYPYDEMECKLRISPQKRAEATFWGPGVVDES